MNKFVAKNWTSMIRPVALEVDSDSVRSNYGKFVAKPLERGYGQTLGNSLRRALLSSLQGAGIVAIRVDGVTHEFGTIHNVKEEVSEIILNLKEVRFKLNRNEEVDLILEKNEEGVVKASDISENAHVHMLNKEHIIANFRVPEGIVFSDYEERYGVDFLKIYKPILDDLCAQGLCEYTVSGVRPTKKGLYFLDDICVSFF